MQLDKKEKDKCLYINICSNLNKFFLQPSLIAVVFTVAVTIDLFETSESVHFITEGVVKYCFFSLAVLYFTSFIQTNKSGV